MKISIVIRSRNDRPFIEQTMNTLLAQKTDMEIELVNIDNQSTDGTWALIRELNPDGVTCEWTGKKYVPGAVLNEAVRRASGDYIVFNNSDCIPYGELFLENLLAPLLSGKADVVFARQVPRPDARPLIRKDYERAFGDGRISAQWRYFFSLASSASTRELLLKEPFDETFQYSEDVEWSYRLKEKGFRIVYVPEAVAEHSHNYTLKETAKRFYNEGLANARIFGEHPRFFRHFLLPLGVELGRDFLYLKNSAPVSSWGRELAFRFVQRWNLYRGSLHGGGSHD